MKCFKKKGGGGREGGGNTEENGEKIDKNFFMLQPCCIE
jgi:hypothetical protein